MEVLDILAPVPRMNATSHVLAERQPPRPLGLDRARPGRRYRPSERKSRPTFTQRTLVLMQFVRLSA